MLVVGGGYPLASGSGANVTACVHHNGHGLYVGNCAKHDQKLSWGKVGPAGVRGSGGPIGAAGAAGATGATGWTGPTGPQGPGATKIVYDASGSASSTPTPIGTWGPPR
jgi:hypothetical protein